MKGHIDLGQELKYRDGDTGRFVFHAETTDKLLLVGSHGTVLHALGGEPARRARSGRACAPDGGPAQRGRDRRSVRPPPGAPPDGAAPGDGFVVTEDEIVAQTRTGKQVLNVKDGVHGPRLPLRAPATTRSRWWARTASCWSSRSTKCRRWRAARACGCRNTRMAACRTRAPSRWPRGSAGSTPPGARGPRPTSPNGRRNAHGRPHGAARLPARQPVHLPGSACIEPRVEGVVHQDHGSTHQSCLSATPWTA
jgi:hypothetical protein